MTTARTGARQSIGLLGAGTVGAALLELMQQRPEFSASASVHKVLVRDVDKTRRAAVDKRLLTTDPDAVLASADILVELIGGVELATDLMLRALRQGKRVITANKAALAERWDDFLPYLQQGLLYFEAAVMAGTPIIGPLTGVLRGSRPLELQAILNGTCNYIISQLEQGVSYQQALQEAQALGYAEADPTLDVEGFDAAHKVSLLARLAFDPALPWTQVAANTTGISRLTPAIIKEAMEDGGRVRLVASIYPEQDAWQVAVYPAYLPATHPLAGSASNRNGMVFKGDAVGEILISGAGAGDAPTASAVLADVFSALAERPGPAWLETAAPLPQGYQATPLGKVL